MKMKKNCVCEIPFAKIITGELGALLPDFEVEVDGDRQVVRVMRIEKEG